MSTFDFSPFFRSSVGFDRIMNLLDSATARSDEASGYPPYNIERTAEDGYRITMAVAGFGEDDLSIVSQDNTLVVAGRSRPSDPEVKYLYRGIAGRAFERRFELADYVKVTGARLVNGLLHIELKREVPEAMKPRTIAIATQGEPKVAIEGKAA